MNVTTDCPVCHKTLVVQDTSDPSVGIWFDYDVLEDGTECDCDFEDPKIEQLVSPHVQDAIEEALYGDCGDWDELDWEDEV